MWELDYKESRRIDAFELWCSNMEKTLESPLDCKDIQPVHPKGNQSWIFIGRTDVEAESPIMLPTWWEELHQGLFKWAWLKAGREGYNREWDFWMASPTHWTWFCTRSENWWWAGKPGMLQSLGRKELHMSEWLNWTVTSLDIISLSAKGNVQIS